MKNQNKDLLIIFTRNIELGKCKTRLAKTVGSEIALNIYSFLVKHTADISRGLSVHKWVFYSEFPAKRDFFDDDIYQKYKQEGSDLGERMDSAFNFGFEKGFSKIIIIGSDIYDLNKEDLIKAFEVLDHNDYVIGPAKDGGYYLLGMKAAEPKLFSGKAWGTNSVFKETLKDLKGKNVELLALRNDVDIYEDIENVGVFQNFLKAWKK
ncbi:MAG: TIGR04282 family arsenosugar biosynthesis glycosyltransferase [Flavobacteriaceae bacterium]